jgi:hypothetical protein
VSRRLRASDAAALAAFVLLLAAYAWNHRVFFAALRP